VLGVSSPAKPARVQHWPGSRTRAEISSGQVSACGGKREGGFCHLRRILESRALGLTVMLMVRTFRGDVVIR
jgi:hypothetical protein